MNHYLLIESRDPYEAANAALSYGLALDPVICFTGGWSGQMRNAETEDCPRVARR